MVKRYYRRDNMIMGLYYEIHILSGKGKGCRWYPAQTVCSCRNPKSVCVRNFGSSWEVKYINDGHKIREEITDHRCGIYSNYEEKYLTNFGKVISINIQEGHRTLNRPESQPTHKQKQTKSNTKKPCLSLITMKTLIIQYNEWALIERCNRLEQITYKGRPARITASFSMETLKARRSQRNIF